MIRKFKSTSKKIVLNYHNDELSTIELHNCDLIEWEALRHKIPHCPPTTVEHFKELKRKSIHDKIVHWVLAYGIWSQQTTGERIQYKVSTTESAQLKNVEINDNLLHAFFTHNFWTKNKTISNYVKHYNEIQLIAAGSTQKGGGESSDRDLAQAFVRRFGK